MHVHFVKFTSGDYAEVSCGYTSVGEALTIEMHADETTSSTGFRAYGSAVKTSTEKGILIAVAKPLVIMIIL